MKSYNIRLVLYLQVYTYHVQPGSYVRFVCTDCMNRLCMRQLFATIVEFVATEHPQKLLFLTCVNVTFVKFLCIFSRITTALHSYWRSDLNKGSESNLGSYILLICENFHYYRYFACL